MKTFITLIALMLSGAFALALDISGTVVLPGGSPAANAQVALVAPDNPIGLGRARFWWRGFKTPIAVVGKDGRFSVRSTNNATAIIAVDDNGYAEVEISDFERNPNIVLRPWGRVEGVFHIGAGFGTNRQMLLEGGFDSTTRIFLELNEFQDKTDQAGRFVFPHVPPGTWLVCDGAEWYGDTVTIKSGETNHVSIGGAGRPLIAKLLIPDKVAQLNQEPLPPSLAYLKFLEPETNGGGSYLVQADLHGANGRLHYSQITTDGTIRVEDVTPGTWWLTADILRMPAGGGSAATFATLGQEVIVPEIPGGRSDEALDLRELKPIIVHTPQVGEEAFPLVVKTRDGETFNLADHRGQYVLLDFEDLFRAPQTNASLEAVWQAYGGNDRFSMLTLLVPPHWGSYVFSEKMQESKWPAAQLATNPWYELKPVRASFGLPIVYDDKPECGFPAIFLVGPDGKIVRAHLQAEDVKAAIGQFLEKK